MASRRARRGDDGAAAHDRDGGLSVILRAGECAECVVYVRAGGAGGQGWEEGTVGDGTVAQLTGTGYEVGPTVSEAVGVRALGWLRWLWGLGRAWVLGLRLVFEMVWVCAALDLVLVTLVGAYIGIRCWRKNYVNVLVNNHLLLSIAKSRMRSLYIQGGSNIHEVAKD